MQPAVSRALVDRMIGTAKLDIPTIEQIEHDDSAMSQALTVVVIVAVASGIGAIRDEGVLGLVAGIVFAIIGWALFSAVAYFVGTRLLPSEGTEATVEQLLRVMGFAQTPGILSVAGIIPGIGPLIVLIGSIWGLVCAIVALRQALETSTGKAILIGLIAAIISGVIIALVALPFGLAALAFA